MLSQSPQPTLAVLQQLLETLGGEQDLKFRALAAAGGENGDGGNPVAGQSPADVGPACRWAPGSTAVVVAARRVKESASNVVDARVGVKVMIMLAPR